MALSDDSVIARLRSLELCSELCDASRAPQRYARAAIDDVARAEEQLGFSLPVLLKRIYLEIANGGFGPGGGLIGIGGGAASELGDDLVKIYLDIRTLPAGVFGEPYPIGHLLIAEWGCATWAAINALNPACPVFAFDLSFAVCGDISRAFIPHRASLHEWLEAWIDGSKMYEEAGRLFAERRA